MEKHLKEINMAAWTTITHAQNSSDGQRRLHDKEMEKKGFVKVIVLTNPKLCFKHTYKRNKGFFKFLYPNHIILTGSVDYSEIPDYTHIECLDVSEYEYQWSEPKEK